MGCDYYKGVFLEIIYIDKNGQRQQEIIELSREGCYFGNNFDRDFMTEEQYFEGKRKAYPVINLYVDGKWLCLENRIDEYKYYVDRIKELDKLVHLNKSFDFWAR